MRMNMNITRETYKAFVRTARRVGAQTCIYVSTDAAAPLPNVATNVHSYYHHPVPGPGHMMHNHGHNPNHTQHHPMLYHDVPVPSIEIESKADDNASTFRTLSSINTTPVGQNDIDNLTQSFSGLNADERNGNV